MVQLDQVLDHHQYHPALSPNEGRSKHVEPIYLDIWIAVAQGLNYRVSDANCMSLKEPSSLASYNSNLMVPLALCKLANKAMALSLIDAAPPSPTPQVYLGEQYVNNATLSDVTFLVEGKRFYAHRICLLAPSDAFRAMFDGGHRKRI
ncbi:hypothetical protein KIW84_052960 [Lathyrus oleraceus]|uniref:BTB domain-containing protein n=1 Tax=Pisum sativum TaxID=3888 RepID=A0A9D4WRF6_PEA|nr:hypothetical protein KIW84_052960 [Pisum sativum]